MLLVTQSMGGENENLRQAVARMTLENISLREDMEAERKFRDKIASAGHSTFSIDEFFGTIFEEVLNLMNSSRGSIALMSQNPLDEKNQFYLVAFNGVNDRSVGTRLISFDEGEKIRQALSFGQSLTINDIRRGHYTSSMIRPFYLGDKPVGAICISNKKDGKDFNSQDESKLGNCVAEIEGQIKNINAKREGFFNFLTCVEARDFYTAVHSVRVGALARIIADELRMNVREQRIIEEYGCLHDLGKLAIPDAILLKEGKLDEKEYEWMKEHPALGVHMLGRSSDTNTTDIGIGIVGFHHERWDGTGYPKRISGEEIPYEARIIAVADAFDAMNSNRTYRQRLEAQQIQRILSENKETQFDRHLSQLFLDVLPSIVYTQINDGEAGSLFHSPFCGQTMRILPGEFVATTRHRSEKFKGYFPCPDCLGD